MCGARARVRSRIRPMGPSGRGAPDPLSRDTGAGAHLAAAAAAARPPSPCRAACWRAPPPRGARSPRAAGLRLNSRSAVFSRSRTRGAVGFMTALPKIPPGAAMPSRPALRPRAWRHCRPPAAYRAGQAPAGMLRARPCRPRGRMPPAAATGRMNCRAQKRRPTAQLPPCGIRRSGNHVAREFRAVRRAGPRRQRKGGIMRGANPRAALSTSDAIPAARRLH